MKDLSKFLSKARAIVRYYRVGPLGDVPSINGKLVEEALRKVMEQAGLGKITTSGLVDLGVTPWKVGFQVKTFRAKNKVVLFARSDKATKEARIADMKARAIASLQRVGATELLMLDIDTFTSDFTVYRLATLQKNGKLRTYGSFLKPDFVQVTLSQTHFRVLKAGLVKLA